jgi:phage shock protein PspC (stress-responsive transcriptional regulator)
MPKLIISARESKPYQNHRAIKNEVLMAKKLFRSRKNRKIAGVCGGIAEYFNVDPIIVRLITLILVLSAGGGLVAYIIAWIVIPEEPDDQYLVPVR